MPERNKNRPPYTLVEMLRIIPRSSLPIGVAWNKCEEAADRIEELEARIAELETALRAVNWRLLQTYEFGKCRSECLRIIDDALTGGKKDE